MSHAIIVLYSDVWHSVKMLHLSQNVTRHILFVTFSVRHYHMLSDLRPPLIMLSDLRPPLPPQNVTKHILFGFWIIHDGNFRVGPSLIHICDMIHSLVECSIGRMWLTYTHAHTQYSHAHTHTHTRKVETSTRTTFYAGIPGLFVVNFLVSLALYTVTVTVNLTSPFLNPPGATASIQSLFIYLYIWN